jgi:hypothetical protein
MDKIKFTEGVAFFVFEVIFCLSFIAMCEVPNYTIGPKDSDACVSRWMFGAGVFFPSAVSSVVSSSTSRRGPGTPK